MEKWPENTKLWLFCNFGGGGLHKCYLCMPKQFKILKKLNQIIEANYDE